MTTCTWSMASPRLLAGSPDRVFLVSAQLQQFPEASVFL